MGTTLQERLDWLDEAREVDADLGILVPYAGPLQPASR